MRSPIRPIRRAVLAAALTMTLAVPLGAAADPAGFTPGPGSGEPSGVLIEEFSLGGPAGPNDSILELANHSADPVPVGGWRVYPCGASGSRGSLWATLPDVTLAPGEVFLLASTGSPRAADAGATFVSGGAQVATGAWVESTGSVVQDRLSISPVSRDSACGPGLPATLDAAADETYQRVRATGDPAADFVAATATPGATNAVEPAPGPVDSPVLVTELANGGRTGPAGELVELGNVSAAPVDVTGWVLSFCAADGSTTVPEPVTLPAGTVLAAGATLVLAPAGGDLPYAGPRLPTEGGGVILRDGARAVRDGVGIYEQDAVYAPAVDSACVRGTALPNRLDLASGQSYQRVASTGDNAADFTVGDAAPGTLEAAPLTSGLRFEPGLGVRVTEVAHTLDGNSEPVGFVELTNTTTAAVSIDGWSVQRCGVDGRLESDPWVAPLSGTLEPGAAVVLAQVGSPWASDAAAVFDAPLTAAGYGLLVRAADGAVVDRFGMLRDRYSPCIDGVTLDEIIAYSLDLSYQRFADTGDNRRDFVHAERTPGVWARDLRAATDIEASRLAPVTVAPDSRPLAATDLTATEATTTADLSAAVGHTRDAEVTATFTGGTQVQVNSAASRVFSGTSPQAPPTDRVGTGETRHRLADLADPITVTDSGGYPYQRFELVLPGRAEDAADLAWTGSSLGGHELQMYAWNFTTSAWDLLAVGSGRDGGAFTMVGRIEEAVHRLGARVEILVQDGPATTPAFDVGADETFEDPGDYDFSIGYIPDPQELTYGYRWGYANEIAWLVSNADARKMAYVSTIGDVTEWWMWGTHLENQAREQFETAQAFGDYLTDAGIPNGTIPGNHDNKWGRDNALYNSYFGPAQIGGTPWFGGAIGADDASSHYDLFEVQGAQFLALNIGYPGWFNHDATLAWAAQVIEDHPDHNVLIFTHDYLQRDGEPGDATDRWNAVGYRIWEDLVVPYRNVAFVMGGHVNGQAFTVARDVGGVPGRIVPQMLSNYQGYEIVDGEKRADFLRLLQVDIDSGTISVNTYSPSLDEHNSWRYASSPTWTPEHDEFLAPITITGMDRQVTSTGLALARDTSVIGTATGADGVAATWSGLTPGAAYVWWVASTDAAGTETVLSEPAVLRTRD
ncbi:lamin tail domain-containing protein [Occultella kanbiaonis]|uniref:lamin tail domain-containing protein n=1 Tax=Occultella kanbiaonis TaxID=2675754 RepID=UPI0012BA1FAA|nr:lamin tail domain-containing protein [Occultella kanbiaonis]